jgi:hypothetical protein
MTRKFSDICMNIMYVNVLEAVSRIAALCNKVRADCETVSQLLPAREKDRLLRRPYKEQLHRTRLVG